MTPSVEGHEVDWYDITEKYHEQTFEYDCRLDSLPEVWQRELAAIWRLEADVNNGAYLQFITNWGFESHCYAVQALHKIGAKKMFKVINKCYKILNKHVNVDEMSKVINKCYKILNKHVNVDEMSQDRLDSLYPN